MGVTALIAFSILKKSKRLLVSHIGNHRHQIDYHTLSYNSHIYFMNLALCR